MKHFWLVLPLFFSFGAQVMAQRPTRILFDFADREAAEAWQTVNDGVMGGVSDGKFKITANGTMEFFGNLSLENNGGFASVRSKPKPLQLAVGDTVALRVRGDGREYSVNLYLPVSRVAFSYRATVSTRAGEWMDVKIPLEDFQATSFGRLVNDANPLDPRQINSVGILLSDGRPGPFQLEVDWIGVP